MLVLRNKQPSTSSRNSDPSSIRADGEVSDPRWHVPGACDCLIHTVTHYSRMLDRFIHPSILTRDVAQIDRARLTAALCIALMVLAFGYAPIFWLLGSPAGVAALAVGICVASGALAVLRWIGWQDVGGNLVVAAFFGTLTLLGCRLGGQGAHAFAWYVAVPVAALSTVGRRSGFAWLAVIIVSLASFYGLHRLGYSFPSDLTPSNYELLGTVSWMGLALLVLGIVLLYHMAKDHMLAERARMEDALRVSEERRALAMSVTNDGMFDWHVGTDNTYFDAQYYQMAGYRPGEYTATFENWAKRVHPDDLASIDQRLQRFVAEQDQEFDVEFRFSRKDGTWMWIRGRARIVERDESGKPKRIIGTHTDITERKRAEEELKNYSAALETANKDLELFSKAAEASSQAKSEFLANMSHEIRTPMTAILGFSEILMESLTDSQQLDAIGTIRLNGEHLLQVINDILDLSKIEAGKLEIEYTTCSPQQVLDDVVAMMGPRAKAKELHLEVEYLGSMPETIQSDPTRLRQILINLTGNAVKFTKSGKVQLVSRLLEVKSSNPKLQIDVIDTGIGVNQEQVTRLFVPFQQADTSTTRKYGGTGLGLVISQRLAQKLGGDIVVESRPGKGSKFTLTIPTGALDEVEFVDYPTERQDATRIECPPRDSQHTAQLPNPPR